MSEQTLARRKQPRTRKVKAAFIPHQGEPVEIIEAITTTDEEAESRTLLADLSREFAGIRRFYREEYGRSKEEAEQDAQSLRAWQRDHLADKPVRELTWGDLSAVAELDLKGAVDLWRRVQHAGIDDLEAGMLALNAVGAKTPIERARFLAIRNKFYDEWNPRGGIEEAMVDTLAQCFSLQLYWMEIAHSRAYHEVESKRERTDRGGRWSLPAQHEADAIEQAHRMADRYNRMFLRTLRQMRDLRRYFVPVTINNPQQVNIATDGGQQVNAIAAKEQP